MVKTYHTQRLERVSISRQDQIRMMNVIRSRLHDINRATENVNKIALSAEDDKRIILRDALAHRHYTAVQI